MFRDSKMSICIGTLLEEEERGGCIAVWLVFGFYMEPQPCIRWGTSQVFLLIEWRAGVLKQKEVSWRL